MMMAVSAGASVAPYIYARLMLVRSWTRLTNEIICEGSAYSLVPDEFFTTLIAYIGVERTCYFKSHRVAQ